MRSQQLKSIHTRAAGRTGGSFREGLDEFAKLYTAQWDDASVKDEVDVAGVKSRRIAARHTLRKKTGNHPKIYHHGEKRPHSVVLVHGITDSPYYMEAIGKRFHSMGFNVVLPLLPAHGLKDPWPAMRKLEHKDWIADIDRIVDIAGMLGERVSMGGFSTGGALTIRKACREPHTVTGGIYLFSAALEIGGMKQLLLESEAGPVAGRAVDMAKAIIRGRKERLKRRRPRGEGVYGIGPNPFKYSVFFYEGASELAEVIEEINDFYKHKRIKRYSDLPHPLFVAHSPIDASAEFDGAKKIFNNHPNRKKVLCDFCKIQHASLVLEKPIREDPNAPANGYFPDMMEMMKTFTERHVL